jgi:hypothetical protein
MQKIHLVTRIKHVYDVGNKQFHDFYIIYFKINIDESRYSASDKNLKGRAIIRISSCALFIHRIDHSLF